MAYVNAKLGNNFLFSKRIGIFYWAYWALGAYGSFSRREAADMAQGIAS